MVDFKKGKAKLMVSDEMVEYVLAKYGKNWNFKDEIADVILEDLRIIWERLFYYLQTAFMDDKGKGKGKVDNLQNRLSKIELDLAEHDKGKAKMVSMIRETLKANKSKEAEEAELKVDIDGEHDKGNAKQAEHDLDDVDLDHVDLDGLDLENKIKKLEEDFSMILKANKSKEAEEAELKVDIEVVCFNDVKYLFTDVEIRIFKERPTTSRAPTRQLAFTSTRSRALITSTFTFKASTRSRAPTASTSNAQAPSTSTPRVYRRIAMTECVLGLRAHNDPNAPPPSAL
nr:hypothetical protein [Tanacetum cinerariifolium]